MKDIIYSTFNCISRIQQIRIFIRVEYGFPGLSQALSKELWVPGTLFQGTYPEGEGRNSSYSFFHSPAINFLLIVCLSLFASLSFLFKYWLVNKQLRVAQKAKGINMVGKYIKELHFPMFGHILIYRWYGYLVMGDRCNVPSQYPWAGLARGPHSVWFPIQVGYRWWCEATMSIFSRNSQRTPTVFILGVFIYHPSSQDDEAIHLYYWPHKLSRNFFFPGA